MTGRGKGGKAKERPSRAFACGSAVPGGSNPPAAASRATTRSASAPARRSIWRQCWSTSRPRCSSWPATRRATTRRRASFRATFSWPIRNDEELNKLLSRRDDRTGRRPAQHPGGASAEEDRHAQGRRRQQQVEGLSLLARCFVPTHNKRLFSEPPTSFKGNHPVASVTIPLSFTRTHTITDCS